MDSVCTDVVGGEVGVGVDVLWCEEGEEVFKVFLVGGLGGF